MTYEKPTRPDLGAVYVDYLGRILTIDAVVPTDPLGRQVQGYIDGNHGARYSCTLPEWARTWRDTESPTPPSEQISQ